MNFDGGHIVNIVDLFRIVEKLVKTKKKVLFEFKGYIRIFFPCFIWNLTTTINRGFDIKFMKILKLSWF